MLPDPKWLEILKVSTIQSLAISLATATFLFLVKLGHLPSLPDWIFLSISFVSMLTFLLFLAGAICAIYRVFPVYAWLLGWLGRRSDAKRFEKYIPFLTKDEREIFAYLLANNQKVFTVGIDGEKAITLISQGFLIRKLRPGQNFDFLNMPVAVPDHIWDVISKYPEEFVYHPSSGYQNPYPWRRRDW